MRDSVANTPVPDPWTDLLRQARSALSWLRAEDLEELAGRAECMLEATIGQDTIRQRIRGPRQETIAGLAREQGLLRSLLIETDRNLKVLERARVGGGAGQRSGEVDSRWVR